MAKKAIKVEEEVVDVIDTTEEVIEPTVEPVEAPVEEIAQVPVDSIISLEEVEELPKVVDTVEIIEDEVPFPEPESEKKLQFIEHKKVHTIFVRADGYVEVRDMQGTGSTLSRAEYDLKLSKE